MDQPNTNMKNQPKPNVEMKNKVPLFAKKPFVLNNWDSAKDNSSIPPHDLITTAHEGKTVLVQLSLGEEEENSLSLLRFRHNGEVYLDDSFIQALGHYSSIAEEVGINIFLPSERTQKHPLNRRGRFSELLYRLVSTLNTFTALKALGITFQVDTAPLEWNQFKHAAIFYGLEFQTWKLWLHTTQVFKKKPVGFQKVLPPWYEVIFNNSLERRLSGYWRALKIAEEGRAEVKKEARRGVKKEARREVKKDKKA